MPKKLTQEKLKELFLYDKFLGIFIRLKTVTGNAKKGDIAGYIDNRGYRRITINRKKYTVSRLAWLYVEGYLPENQIDHRNRIRHDDKWHNLRHVSQQCNTRNSKIYNTNTSGITGVKWHKRKRKWRSEIMISGKTIHLGYFDLKLNAAKARWKAEVKYGFPNCNTTSTAYLYLQKG